MVCRRKARLDVAQYVLLVVRDVLARRDIFVATALDPVLMQRGRVRLQRFHYRGDAGQHLILHIYERERLLRHMRVDRCDCRYRVALIENLVLGEYVLADGDALLRHLWNRRHRREVGRCNNRLHIRVRLRPARVDGLDAGMRVRAAKHLAMQQPREVHIRTVERAARNLINTVVPHRARADDLIIFLREHCHHVYHLLVN